MGEKDFWLKIGLIVAIVALSITFIWPPQDKLKPGIDLGGGYSLLFEIDDTGDTRTDLAESVMNILKQRVDPGGNRNLVWRPIGRNRLEIQMPLPPKNQREAREAYEAARNAINATQISRSQILNALALPPGERDQVIDKLVGVVPSRRPLFTTLVETLDRYKQLQGAESQPAASSQPVDVAKAQEMDRLFNRRNETLDKLLATNLNPQVLSDLLDLDRKSPIRQEKLDELRKQHPDLQKQMDSMVDKYEVWSKQKGYLDDPSDLMRLLRGAGKLEFRIVPRRDPSSGRLDANKPEYQESAEKYIEQLAKFGPRPQEGDNYRWFEISKPDENSITKDSRFIIGEYLGTKYVLAHATPDMGLLNDGTNSWKLRRAYPERDRAGGLSVGFELDSRGGEKFSRLTGDNLQRPLGIFLDDKAVSAPNINDRIGSSGIITGRFTPAEVQSLINTLEAGVLPARLKEVPLQEKGVGPSLGATNIQKGLTASAIAFVLVVLFMAIYYTYSGVIADLAVMLNLVITLGIMAFLGNTFTLPGIAGMILTLGMAVDANVLINERMREELQRGVSMRMAMKLGYEKAFSAILDGNVTTIITAVILAYLGSEEIKGFGQTLGIGLCVSMFTALFVTRQYFNIMVPQTLDKRETSKAWIGTGVLAILGGGFFGLGWLLHRNSKVMMQESALVGLGKFFLIVFATAFVLLGTMWLFRWLYRAMGHHRDNRMPMLKFLGKPNVDWMHKYRYFWTASCVIVLVGILFAWQAIKFDPNAVLDIEFIGGTNVQVGLKPEYKSMTDEQIAARITGKNVDDRSGSVGWLHHAATLLPQAKVTKLDEMKFNIVPAEPLTTPQMQGLLSGAFDRYLARGGITSAEHGVNVSFEPERSAGKISDVASVQSLLNEAAQYDEGSAQKLRNPRVQLVEEQTAEGPRKAFEIVTTETNKQLVSEALLASMRNYLEVQEPIEAKLLEDPTRAPDGLFPIKMSDRTVADVLGREAGSTAAGESVENYKGGVMLVFNNLQPAASIAEIGDRLKQMQLQPDLDVVARDRKVIGIEPDNSTATEGGPAKYKSIAIAVTDPMHPYVEESANQDWRTNLANKELKLAQAAMASSRALQRVTQFAPQVASEAGIKAAIAIVLSMIAIAIYVWVRFGSADFGIAAIIALYHDVAVALSAIVAAHVLHDTTIGHYLKLQDFRVDLALVAALLTIVGYSINDTIIIFDRIRENRGRMATISPHLVNRSVNETLSRTIITSFTVFLTVVVMYFFGGEGIHGFAFAMMIGVLTGTYSSVAIAPPLMMRPKVMWLTTIVLGSLTLIGLTSLLNSGIMRNGLMLVLAAAAVYSIYRVLNIYRGQVNQIMTAPTEPVQQA